MSAQNDLIAAVQAGNAAEIRDLLAHDPALASARDAQGLSAIMHALYRRQTEALNLLLESDPPLDIFEAASLGRTQRIDELVQQDASIVNRYSSDGFTPLHLACYFAPEHTATHLLQKGASPAAVSRNPMHLMPLHSAASAQKAQAVKALLEHGAEVNAKQEKGWTPLHAAAQNSDQATAQILLRHGADPNLANDDGVTAIDLAKKSGLKLDASA